MPWPWCLPQEAAAVVDLDLAFHRLNQSSTQATIGFPGFWFWLVGKPLQLCPRTKGQNVRRKRGLLRLLWQVFITCSNPFDGESRPKKGLQFHVSSTGGNHAREEASSCHWTMAMTMAWYRQTCFCRGYRAQISFRIDSFVRELQTFQSCPVRRIRDQNISWLPNCGRSCSVWVVCLVCCWPPPRISP